MIRLFAVGFFFSCWILQANENEWTWLYAKQFSDEHITLNAKRTSMIFEKINTPQFNQLIFSWNSFRPPNGSFHFYVQARDVSTKKWYDWHLMSTWGMHEQKTFFSKNGTTFAHVRLEAPEQSKLDGLRIRIVATKKANLGLIKSIFVCISDFQSFCSERYVSSLRTLPSVYIRGVHKISQMTLNHERKEHLCSPTSCSMLTSFFLHTYIDPVKFAAGCYDQGLDSYGSWPFNVAQAFCECNGKIQFFTRRLRSFNDLYQLLSMGRPVAVSVRGAIKGAPQEYSNGHLLVVVGWNQVNKKVICYDPAFKLTRQTHVEYDLPSFLSAWEKSRRLTYIPLVT